MLSSQLDSITLRNGKQKHYLKNNSKLQMSIIYKSQRPAIEVEICNVSTKEGKVILEELSVYQKLNNHHETVKAISLISWWIKAGDDNPILLHNINPVLRQ